MNSLVKASSNPIEIQMSEKYGINQDKLKQVLKATAFKGNVNDEQMFALMVVADKYDLNPFVKEIYAFPGQDGGITPVVGIDGWDHIINNHPQFDGVEFLESEKTFKPNNDSKACPEWIECAIYRKDRSKPIKVKEYLDECFRNTTPWKSHTKRMLRHKALIQCARIAFGYGGIYDEDEAERIVQNTTAPKMITPVEVQVVETKIEATKSRKQKAESVPVAAPEPEQPPEPPAPVLSAPSDIDEMEL